MNDRLFFARYFRHLFSQVFKKKEKEILTRGLGQVGRSSPGVVAHGDRMREIRLSLRVRVRNRVGSVLG
jgi:hypothetical protein